MADNTLILKYFEGNKRIGSHHPIAVVLADGTASDTPFGEKILFIGLPQLSFIQSRFNYQKPRGDLPAVFSLKYIFDTQLKHATEGLEFALSKHDRTLSKQVFWEGYPFKFEETDLGALMRLKLLGRHKSDLQTMFAQSQSAALEGVRETLRQLSGIQFLQEPPPESGEA
jgi:hypothetical protein